MNVHQGNLVEKVSLIFPGVCILYEHFQLEERRKRKREGKGDGRKRKRE